MNARSRPVPRMEPEPPARQRIVTEASAPKVLTPEAVADGVAAPADARLLAEAAVAAPSRRAAAREPHRTAWILWAMLVAAVIFWGLNAHLERYMTPQRGLGYGLGITGGSMMLLLLVYSARKRARWLAWMGSIPAWFQFHMVLGVVGPVLILFHSNFKLGATNSNVALFSMLLVAGSGVVGRYIYTRIHAHLDGREESLEDLQAIAERIRSQSTLVTFMPGLLDAIDEAERRVVHPAEGAIGRLLHPFTAGTRAAIARWRVHRAIRQTVARAARAESGAMASDARRIGRVASQYADRRIDAARRVSEYRLYARLFSFWHVLHIPLFFMLLFAAIAHVIAVNLY